MRNDTRKQFDKYRARVAHLNGVSDTSASFSVDPAIQQTMEQKIQESSAFLTSINMPIVVDQLGQKIGLGVAGPSASRTDTTTKTRATRDITAFDPNGYQCVKTNFDTHLTYAKLDAWARHKAFQNMVRDAVLKRQGLDRIMVGWNGTHAAADTSLTQQPLRWCGHWAHTSKPSLASIRTYRCRLRKAPASPSCWKACNLHSHFRYFRARC